MHAFSGHHTPFSPIPNIGVTVGPAPGAYTIANAADIDTFMSNVEIHQIMDFIARSGGSEIEIPEYIHIGRLTSTPGIALPAPSMVR